MMHISRSSDVPAPSKATVSNLFPIKDKVPQQFCTLVLRQLNGRNALSHLVDVHAFQ
jgi:hypothetical protein